MLIRWTICNNSVTNFVQSGHKAGDSKKYLGKEKPLNQYHFMQDIDSFNLNICEKEYMIELPHDYMHDQRQPRWPWALCLKNSVLN